VLIRFILRLEAYCLAMTLESPAGRWCPSPRPKPASRTGDLA